MDKINRLWLFRVDDGGGVEAVYPLFFFFNDTATPDIYPLPRPDALPIPPSSHANPAHFFGQDLFRRPARTSLPSDASRNSYQDIPSACRHANFGADRRHHRLSHCRRRRSEEHTSELQSRLHLVCRLLLEKKKTTSKPS